MANYSRPDVYVEELSTGEKPVQATATSVGAFIGRTPRGESNKAILVTSWTDFTDKFALGCKSPFLFDSDLSNAVFGFFQNGGSRCYIINITSSSATASKIALDAEGLEISAKDVGDWSNDRLGVKVISKSGSLYDVNVYVGAELVEVIADVTNTEGENNFKTVINANSNYIKVDPVTDKTLVATEEIKVLKGGDNASNSISNTDYTNALANLDIISDVNLVAIPKLSGDKIVGKALVEYCDNRNDCFAIIDCNAKTVEEAKTFRESLGGTNGAVYFPSGKIVDPLGRNNSLKTCALSGHIMGVYARTDDNRGVYKAPAGEDCIVRGLVSLEATLSKADLDVLNPLGINCIIAKPNKGIMIWGARSLSSDPAKRYVSDVRYDIMVRTTAYEGTQWAVFEPNNSDLWDKLDTSLRSFLDLEWRNGALRGETADEAYYVKCDSELNTETTINNGQVIMEIGYAKQKPAEFVIVRIVQKANS